MAEGTDDLLGFAHLARHIPMYRKHGFTVEGRLREEFRQPDGSWADDLWLALILGPDGEHPGR